MRIQRSRHPPDGFSLLMASQPFPQRGACDPAIPYSASSEFVSHALTASLVSVLAIVGWFSWGCGQSKQTSVHRAVRANCRTCSSQSLNRHHETELQTFITLRIMVMRSRKSLGSNVRDGRTIFDDDEARAGD